MCLVFKCFEHLNTWHMGPVYGLFQPSIWMEKHLTFISCYQKNENLMIRHDFKIWISNYSRIQIPLYLNLKIANYIIFRSKIYSLQHWNGCQQKVINEQQCASEMDQIQIRIQCNPILWSLQSRKFYSSRTGGKNS